MKVGSIVELVNDKNWKYLEEANDEYPVKGPHYTIRGIMVFPNGIGITLEEIVNPKRMFKNGFVEMHFDITRFRELLPPMDIEDVINEIMAEPV